MALFSRWLHNSTVGSEGEEIIARYLRNSGLKVIARNWRVDKSEIDIVALNKKQKQLHIVEVKSRTSDNWEAIGQSITPSKVAALRRGAFEFISLNPKYSSYTLSFDIGVVLFSDGGHRVEYIKNIRF